MAQYIINATMIWLLSLLAFDLLLKRESYHAYNRAYLLLTLILGLCLPLITLQKAEIVQGFSTGPASPVLTAMQAKDTAIQTAVVAPPTPVDWLLYLSVIYYCGVAARGLFLIKETISILTLLRSGVKTKDGVWCIVETAQQHSPFSFGRYIFISNKKEYSAKEWQIILAHEKEHGKQLHIADNILVELIKTMFWFHPLVYLFQKRLVAVHEYQADAVVKNAPREYGQFLITQSMLKSGPALSHSLNCSPIKNRIVMLTRKSSLTAGLKRLIAFPVMIVCISLFTQNAISKENGKETKEVYYNGNVFELQYKKSMPFHVENDPGYKLLSLTGTLDSFVVQNPATGKFEKIVPVIDTIPVKMNGREIHNVFGLTEKDSTLYSRTTGKEIRTFLSNELAPVLKKAPDGYYAIFEYLILDDEGNVAYIQQPRRRTQNNEYEKAIAEMETKIFNAIKNTSGKFTPVKQNGKAEIMKLPSYIIEVNNHVVTVGEKSKYGC